MFRRVARHDVIDSTSEAAFRALGAGTALHGDVHVARGQTAGRGRRGACWESAPGAGLYVSFIGLPPAPAPAPAALTMAAGLAVLECVRELGLARAGLKWPNDVVVGDAKLAGVLVETRGLDPEHPHYVVGVGLNVTQRRFSDELERDRAATSLALEGIQAQPDDVLVVLATHLVPLLERARSDADGIARDWLEATALARQQVEVRGPDDQVVTGRLLEATLGAGLCIETADGARAYVPLEHVRALK